MRTVIGQVRVATKPDPDNFEAALAAYIESDFEVHRLMVENSNLKQQLEKLLAEKQKRAEVLLWKLVEHNIKYFWD